MGPHRSAAPDPGLVRLVGVPSPVVLASVPISSQLPLIESKLVAPLLPPEITRRSRALDRMSGEERVILVVAPLGYGKSVVAQQWLDESSRDTAWLSLDLIDSSPQSFWMHLVGGLRRVLPTIDDELGLLLAERGPDHVFVAALLRQIEQAERPVNLVLDDLARIEDRSIIDGLALLVERVGHVVRVLMTSRMTPLLPLARWRSLGWLVELGEKDLRLDHDEARSIARLSGRPVDDPGGARACAISSRAGRSASTSR